MRTKDNTIFMIYSENLLDLSIENAHNSQVACYDYESFNPLANNTQIKII